MIIRYGKPPISVAIYAEYNFFESPKMCCLTEMFYFRHETVHVGRQSSKRSFKLLSLGGVGEGGGGDGDEITLRLRH